MKSEMVKDISACGNIKRKSPSNEGLYSDQCEANQVQQNPSALNEHRDY